MKSRNQFRNFLFALAWLLAGWGIAASAFAQVALDDLPEVAQGIGVTQKLGQDLPMSLEFEDDKNRFIQFGELFTKNRPVLLSFNYSNCPKICVVQLQNLATELQNIDLIPGRDFEIVSVSLDPTEQSKQLAETKAKYVTAYGNLDSAKGWHFLRGDKGNISALADACGFKYKYIPAERFYSHPAAFIFCTSDGRISRYLDGLEGGLDRQLRPALIEAGRGEIGSLKDKVLYFSGCYIFDATTGKYSMSAIRLMRLAGMGTVVCLLVAIVPYWVRRNHAVPRSSIDSDINATDERSGES